MKECFLDLVQIISKNINEKEQFCVWYKGECFDYMRFNGGLIRQAGTVEQRFLDLELINGNKHAFIKLGLSGNLVNDRDLLLLSLSNLRKQLMHSQEDPFFFINTMVSSTETISPHSLPDKHIIPLALKKYTQGLDLVGYYLAGPIYKGFANSFGQVNWYEKSSFIVDTSIYHAQDKAIKQSYADTQFDENILAEKFEQARYGIQLFNKESITINPGHYRVYFSPSAVFEILSMMNWGGFSKKCLETKNSPLMPLAAGSKTLSSMFSINENTKNGIGPNFQSKGFIKPPMVPIISHGQLKNTLISPKTAKEYCIDHNGANDDEMMCSIDMQEGDLLESDILTTLDDGLYINNLWYLNFSDRQNACLTGMSRFLCYVVKDGKPLAPFSVMRFDDSIYRIFGENLKAITQKRELIIDGSTYDERSTNCALLPGIIAENVRFTL